MRRSVSENNLITMINPKSIISEAYRTLRTNIQYCSMDRTVKVIMVTSSQNNEGKSTTISNLAVAYAQEGKDVLIIDADLRSPSLHHVFSNYNRTGLTSIIAKQHSWQEVISDTTIPNLSLISAGPVPPNPSELLSSKQMASLIEELKPRYDIILIDTPPLLLVPDPLIVSAYADGVVMVVSAGKADKEAVKKAKAQLERANANILGAVFNNTSRKHTKYMSPYGT